MERTTTPRILIMLWKWKELQEKNVPYDEIFVSDDQYASIVRVNEEKRESFPEIFTHIIKNKLVNSVMLMFHLSAIDKKQWQSISSKLDQEYRKKIVTSPIFFGGAKNFIYYDCDRDSGLINEHGGFAINQLCPFLGATGQIQRVRVSVVEYPEHNTAFYTIQKKYFDKVWNYYTFRTKQVTFELHEDLFIYLVGLESSKAVSLIELLKEEKNGLKERVISFCEDGEEQVGIRPNQKIYEPYQDLVTFLQTASTNQDGYLLRLRELFANFFNAMPEKIYG